MEIKNNNGWKIVLTGEVGLLNDSILNQLKEYNDNIYFNNVTCVYWMYDFKIDDVWFNSIGIDMNSYTITFEVFQ